MWLVECMRVYVLRTYQGFHGKEEAPLFSHHHEACNFHRAQAMSLSMYMYVDLCVGKAMRESACADRERV